MSFVCSFLVYVFAHDVERLSFAAVKTRSAPAKMMRTTIRMAGSILREKPNKNKYFFSKIENMEIPLNA